MMALTIGTASARPGEAAFGRLFIGELRDGTTFGLPVAAINGAKDGPLLYIQAGSDGNELNGVLVVREALKQIDPQVLRGGILIVNPLNYHGFQQDSHRNPLDNKKTNRTFPGNSEGSITERISAAVFPYIKKCDFVLDLHQGGTSRMIDEVRIRVGEDHKLHSQCLELAKVFGIQYILDQKGPDGQLARVAPDEGVPTIDPELGGCVGWDNNSISKGVHGVLNVLRYYHFLEGEVQLPDTYTIVSNLQDVYSRHGGLIDLKVNLYDEVKPGDLLFTITDSFGNVTERVNSAVSGVLWRTRRLPMTATGEQVCTIGVGVRREDFSSPTTARRKV